MITISKEFSFSAAHRVQGHPKCGRLHGHNYQIVVHLAHPQGYYNQLAELDDMGFVLDYGILKKVVKPVIDVLDHRYMVSLANLSEEDPYMAAAENAGLQDDIVALPIQQTSAECLAEWLKHAIQLSLADFGLDNVAVTEVEVWETQTNCARA